MGKGHQAVPINPGGHAALCPPYNDYLPQNQDRPKALLQEKSELDRACEEQKTAWIATAEALECARQP